MGPHIKAIIVALLPSVALAQVFPAPDGPFQVHMTEIELVDQGRIDPFNDTHPRRLMVTQFTPVPFDKCERTCETRHIPIEISRIEDEIFDAYYGDIGWPGDIFDKLALETCCELKESYHRRPSAFPTVLLDPGFNTTRLLYASTAQNIASLGYRVILMDHPYETDAVKFPNGDIILGGRIAVRNDTESTIFGLNVRGQDASFVLDYFKICSAVYAGHSYGGASAVNLMPSEPRIAGGVNLDGTLFGSAIETGVPRPFLMFGSQGHNLTSDPSWTSFWNAMDEHCPDVWDRELTLDNSVHGSYWDLPAIGDITGLRADPTLEEILFGPLAGDKVMEVLRAYLDAFFRFTLLGEDEGLLKEESPLFPDVHFLR